MALFAASLAVPFVGLDLTFTARAAGAAINNFTDSAISNPLEIMAGPDGALWFTNQGSNSIGRIATDGTVTTYTDPTILQPSGITKGSDDALWFTNDSSPGSIGRIDTSGVVTNFADPSIDSPVGITSGPDGALWFTNNGGIGRITTSGSLDVFTDVSISNPVSIASGPDSALWFTNQGSDSIGRITTTGTVSNYTAPGLIANAEGIARGTDGALWFTDTGTDSIGRITTTGTVTNFTAPGSISAPLRITGGWDGALWFTDYANNSIGRITTDGTVTAYSDASISGPVGITMGPDGAMWFANYDNNSIGRIDSGGVPNAPTGAAGASGNGQVTLGWTAPANDGGFALTDYSVSVYDTSGGSATGVTGATTRLVGSTSTNYAFTGLTNGTGYKFKVAAVNSAGTGTQSTLSAAVTPATVPDAPTEFAIVEGNQQMALSWTAPASNGGSAITDYAVDVFDDSGGAATGVTGASTRLVGSATTNYVFTGLTNGTAYTFKVAAVNAAGTGAQSSLSAAKIPTCGACLASPLAIAKASDGSMWVTNNSYPNYSISRIRSDGVGFNYTDPSMSLPYGIAQGPDGAMWFTNALNNSIGRITTAGVVTNYTDPVISQPFGIIAGPPGDDGLWFTNSQNNRIGRIDASTHAITSFGGAGISNPQSLTVGPDGALWVTSTGSSMVNRITTTGTVTSFTANGMADPQGITAGPDGGLWFTDDGSHFIWRIDAVTHAITRFSDPSINNGSGIATGPDGAMWFTSPGDNLIGRITTRGAITTYGDPNISTPLRIARGPNGKMWFTNQGNSTVGQVGAAFAQATTAPVAAQVTEPNDAVWSVPISNPTDADISNVTVTLHANADGPVPRTFHTSLMPGCSPGGGNSLVCTLANVPANATVQLNVYVPTTALAAGRTLTGDVNVSASGQPDTPGTLGTVTVVSCGAQCEKVVASPGVPAATPAPTPAAPTQQAITLPADQAGADPQPVAVTLSSITPSSSESAPDQKLCPTATGQTHCSGQISSFIANFTAFNDPVNPIRVSMVARWGSAVPSGRVLMEKNSGGDPLFLLACSQNSTTHQYNVPCVLPETRTGSSAAGNLTTTNTILFTGLDVHFARRTATGGTVIKPPAAPTALTATAAALNATLKWKAPTVTNGAGVTSYVLTVLSGGAVVKTVTFASPALTETIGGLVNGKAYTFKVAAGNVAGVGPPTAPSTATVVGAPGPPTAVKVARVASGLIRVTFAAPAATNGAAITGYTATCTSTNGGVTKTKAGTASPLTVTALSPAKTYKCTVKATNSRGTGPPSTASTPVTA